MSEFMQLNINVQTSHAAEFMQLVANYLRDPGDVVASLRALNTRCIKEHYFPKEEAVGPPMVTTGVKTEVPPKKTLYQTVVEDCECGLCYSKLLRDDKVPWRSDGVNGFTSAKHGKYKPFKCPVITFIGMGYIYRQPEQRKLEVQIDKIEKEKKIQQQKIELNNVKINKRHQEHKEIQHKNQLETNKMKEKYTNLIAEEEDLKELNNEEYRQFQDQINQTINLIINKKRRQNDLSFVVKNKTFEAPSSTFFTDRAGVQDFVRKRFGPFRFSRSKELKSLQYALRALDPLS
jgi:hypothetical protein